MLVKVKTKGNFHIDRNPLWYDRDYVVNADLKLSPSGAAVTGVILYEGKDRISSGFKQDINPKVFSRIGLEAQTSGYLILCTLSDMFFSKFLDTVILEMSCPLCGSKEFRRY